MAGILDAILQRAPGLIAQGLEAKRVRGQMDEQRDMQRAGMVRQQQQDEQTRQRDEQARRRQIEQDAIQRALLGERQQDAQQGRQLTALQIQKAQQGLQPQAIQPEYEREGFKDNPEGYFAFLRSKRQATTAPQQAPQGQVFTGKDGQVYRLVGNRAVPVQIDGSGGGLQGPSGGDTAGMRMEAADVASVMSDVSHAIRQAQENPEAFGLKNMPAKLPFGIGTVARSVRDAGGVGPQAKVAARAAVANVATALGKLRSGGAITEAEFERLSNLLPEDTLPAEAIVTRLQEIQGYLDRRLAAFGGGRDAGGSGGDSPPPGDTLSAYLQQARNAIQQGADPGQVAAKYRELTGREFEG